MAGNMGNHLPQKLASYIYNTPSINYCNEDLTEGKSNQRQS